MTANATFTTHKIAKMCSVYPSTVINWINEGKLKSFLTAGGHHRVTRAELVNFLTRLKIPLPPELAQEKKILIVDDEEDTCFVVERAFQRHAGIFITKLCHTGIEALIKIGEWHPHLVVLDIVLPKIDGCQVCRILKSKPETQAIKIVGISGNRNFDERSLRDYRIDAFFAKPLDLPALVAKSMQLLGMDIAQSQTSSAG
ncbi:MAG: response regulator [Elusimicrobia bacterium]|nr:response regulator [Elusimicrobiota bacterium]